MHSIKNLSIAKADFIPVNHYDNDSFTIIMEMTTVTKH